MMRGASIIASKYQQYADLAAEQTRQVTGSMSNWTDFLSAAGRLYKYPFEEQLMIHAQRPDAVACAPLETWNKPMNRFVKKGSKGIALLDNSSSTPKLKYVFDVADTQDGRQNARRPFVWELRQEHEAAVLEALQANHGGIASEAGINREQSENSFGSYLFNLAESLAARYYDDNRRDIIYSAEGSFLDGYDEYNVGISFRKALTVSTAYALMSRCGIDPSEYIENEDFQPVFNFNTPKSVCALGEAVSTVSEEVLREIEVTIKKYEREHSAERGTEHGSTNLHAERGLSDSRHSDTRNDGNAGQIRNDEEELSEPSQADSVLGVRAGGDSVQPLSGNRTDGDGTFRENDVGIDNTITAAGQGDRPDGLDSAHERSESVSRESDIERVDFQLEQDENNDIIVETPSDMSGVSVSDKSGLYQAFYNAFGNDNSFAASLEQAIINSKQDRFMENIVKQRRIKAALFGLLQDRDKTEQAYQIVVEQHLLEPPQGEQISLFPTENEQITAVQEAEQPEVTEEIDELPIKITQDDIDAAIIAWNGDNDSKARVFFYMQEFGRARNTSEHLKYEYGTVKARISFITHANPVPIDELEKIFDKLYRREKSRSEETGGTGLGLSISRRIIELHGGTLTARQTENGTAFDIYLPM